MIEKFCIFCKKMRHSLSLISRVRLSTTLCWCRIQKLEEDAVIEGRVAVLSPEKVNAYVTVFVSICTNTYSHEWLKCFSKIVQKFREVVEFYRISGDIDYLLRVIIPNIEVYDFFYKKLIAKKLIYVTFHLLSRWNRLNAQRNYHLTI
ncbi:Transcriptional regulator [Bartonella quintana str. Toulouse]|uniref:Transcriptional regulator n=2 Tax=Bartonella quintana TaxID=803 RepID=A0A0H3M2V7_BARQU|nr:Transcriptional regulator [Bartonella quintana str. Toulouse]